MDSMGAGKKTQQFYAGEGISCPPLSSNGTILTRNLRKSDLGGVIFGCRHSTMQECLSKQLFGSQHGHFSYVRNIEEGLPLFLFNYSDRKLHGIYEAASHGHMLFDAYAWTDGGTEKTPFPAQVYIRIRTQCQPLTENQFSKIIADNYFSYQHFWFELDHAQARGLMALFKPLPADVVLSPVASLGKECFPALPTNKWVPLSGKEHLTAVAATRWKPIGNKQHMSTEASKLITDLKLAADIVSEGKSASVHCNGGDGRLASPNKSSGTGLQDTDSKSSVSDWEDLAEDNAQNLSSGAKVDGVSQTSQKQQLGAEWLEKEEERVLRLLQKLAADRQHLESSSNGRNSTGSDHAYENAEDVQSLILATVNYKNAEDVERLSTSDINHRNAEMVQVIEELKERTSNLEKQRAEQDREMELLRNAFTDSGRKIQLLQDRVKELESKIIPSVPPVDDSIDKFTEQCFGPEDVIYLIGGFDGHSWLSALDCFSPSLNTVTPLKSMSSARSYASVVALDGTLYVLGGGDGNLWFDSVECYNRRQNEWASCPSMLREKGSLAGATLNGKIYAIGGGDGVKCFSEVEMFDLAQGGWINNQSMLHTRFAPAAAELNGAIYALGGYDGNAYLRSVERFDPREGTWTEVPSMNIRRGCHSLAVFNEKLYCVGGYDGEKMVSSIETFDPRLNSWVMGEPMKCGRGYAAIAVLGNSLFAIGGVKDDKNIEDMVECYREGTGWTTSGWKAIGKRCFCSAIVL